MPETESKFTVSVEAQGVEATKAKLVGLERAAAAAGDAPSKAFSAATANLEKMGAATDRLVSKMERLAKIIARTSRAQRAQQEGGAIQDGTQVYGRSGGVSGTGPSRRVASPGSVSGQVPLMGSTQSAGPGAAFAPAKPPSAASAFGLGMFQSMLPGNLGFLQRGPGAIPQGLGLAAGRAVSGLASIPFAGAGGMSAALSVLGPLAAPFQRFLSQSESGISMQRQQMEMAPLLASAGIDSTGGVSETQAARMMAQGRKLGYSDITLKGYVDSKRNEGLRSQIRSRGYDPARLMGANVNEGQAFLTQLALSGGNRGDQMSSSFVQEAMAAKTVYGVDANTSGAFALAARSNAVRGSEGLGADKLLLNAISQVQSLGLSGADAQNYLQQIAEGIRQFQVSGMPLQMESMRNITAGLTGLGGMSSLQAQRSASGLAASSQAFRDSGPRSGADLVMMRAAGFQGGLSSMLKTKRLLGTNSEVYSDAVMQTLGLYAKAPDKELARDSMRQFMQSKGMVPDDRVIESIIDEQGSGKDIAKTYNDAIGRVQEAPDVSSQQLLAKASAAIPSTVAKQVDITNTGLSMSVDAASITQELDSIATQTSASFSRFSTGMMALARLSGKFANLISGNGNTSGMPSVRPAN